MVVYGGIEKKDGNNTTKKPRLKGVAVEVVYEGGIPKKGTHNQSNALPLILLGATLLLLYFGLEDTT